ncbi:hypothetical protein NIES4102_21250 [Chondrocystis sp. NIES-4102]|nr:hypothetical protein NIES4102_21250 [Chondrocystis sp. NIES-4102]
MAKRSLQASLAGVKQAKKAFDNLGWTQDNLAAEVNLKTRQPVWRFFTNRPIERYTFIEICSVLELNWREIAENPPSEGIDSEAGQLISIEALVKQVRSQRRDKVQQQCGILHLLDTNYPVAIEDIYVEINISQEITSRQWIEITNLEYPTCKELNQTASKTIPGIEAITDQSKLRILGQPGSGKTTFLQYLAIECNRGNFASNLIPIFISLRDFADESKKTGDFSQTTRSPAFWRSRMSG